MQQKGFTLIELLIVIAIIAVLSVVVVLTLNPAELLRQARDSTRISDLSSLNSAINLYLADSGVFTSSTGCYVYATSSAATCTAAGFALGATTTAFGGASSTIATSSRVTTGSGWIPVNFATMSAGAPFGILPVDPTNNAQYFYALAIGSSSTYKLNGRMESSKYSTGTSAVGVNDGGTTSTLYEVGNTLTL